MKKTSVIVVTAGCWEYIDRCLVSVKAQSLEPSEVIVIDNSADPFFKERLSNAHPPVRVCSNPSNLYYCPSLNTGIRQASGDLILCLNDDVWLDRDFMREAVAGFEKDPAIGMVSGKVLRPDRKHLDSAGLFLTPWRTARERGYGTPDTGQYDREEYIFGINGAVMFLRKKMLEEIKEGQDYFDPDFHIFFEDLDVSWRAQRHGWRAYYTPRALAHHKRGGTVRTPEGIDKPYARRFLSPRLHADLIKNRYLAIIKNETVPGFICHLPFMLVFDLFSWLYVIIRRPAVIKIFFSQINVFKTAFNKRNNA